MTRDEAIHYAKCLKNNWTLNLNDLGEFCDMAIEALEQQTADVVEIVRCKDCKWFKRLNFEKASLPSHRIEAIKKLQAEGFDVAIRLSPLIPEYMDFNKLNDLGINKAIIEFLRVNTWVRRWFDIDYTDYTVKQSGYCHLPLEKKIELYNRITIPNKSVCEDVTEHYNYWKTINPNADDCCNLRRTDE